MENKEHGYVWRVGGLVGLLLCLFLLAISIKEIKEISYVGKDLTTPNTIVVTGTGDVVSKPDVATFSFSVTETAKTVGDAQTAATTKINAVLKALSDNGVADKDIQTTSYSINPHYEYTDGVCASNGPCRPGTSVLTGYDVSQSIEVKVRDLTKAGTLFQTVGSLGVDNVNGLSFSVDQPDTLKAQARSIAIQDAKTKAQTLASQLGVSLVRITSFYDSSDNPVYPYATDAVMAPGIMKASVATPPQVPTGEQKITSNVTITYEIN